MKQMPLILLLTLVMSHSSFLGAEKQPDDVYDVSAVEFKYRQTQYIFGPTLSAPLPYAQAARAATIEEMAQLILAFKHKPEALISGGGFLYSGIPYDAKVRSLTEIERLILKKRVPIRLIE